MLGVIATGAAMLMAPRQPDRSLMEAVSRRVLTETEASTALDVMAALDAQHRVTRPIGRFFGRYDLLVTPTLGQLPARHATLDYDDPEHTVRSWLRRIFTYGPFTAPFHSSQSEPIRTPGTAHSLVWHPDSRSWPGANRWRRRRHRRPG